MVVAVGVGLLIGIPAQGLAVLTAPGKGSCSPRCGWPRKYSTWEAMALGFVTASAVHLGLGAVQVLVYEQGGRRSARRMRGLPLLAGVATAFATPGMFRSVEAAPTSTPTAVFVLPAPQGAQLGLGGRF